MSKIADNQDPLLLDAFAQVEREIEDAAATEQALTLLARRLVESEEVSEHAEHARGALRGLELNGIAALLKALEPPSKTFKLRPFGLTGVDQARLRAHLQDFLRLALQPAARLQVVARRRPAVRVDPDPLAGLAMPDAATVAALDPELIDAAIEANATLGVLDPSDALGQPKDPYMDPLPAGSDLEAAVAKVREQLAGAIRDFDELVGWAGARASTQVQRRFRRALSTAGECVEALRSEAPSAATLTSDVHAGVVQALRLAGEQQLRGTIEGADILTRVVLELAGLVSSSLKKDDTSRAAYTRKMRQRAERVRTRRDVAAVSDPV